MCIIIFIVNGKNVMNKGFKPLVHNESHSYKL